MALSRGNGAVEATAYHEAGHAVMAWIQGIPVRFVTIDPDFYYIENGSGMSLKDDGVDGRCVLPKRFGDVFFLINPRTCQGRERLQKIVLITLAGEIAERLFRPRSRGYHEMAVGGGIADDLILHKLAEDAEEQKLYLRWIRHRAKGLLKRHWKKVEALVRELLLKKTLKGTEVESIFRRFLDDQIRAWKAKTTTAPRRRRHPAPKEQVQ